MDLHEHCILGPLLWPLLEVSFRHMPVLKIYLQFLSLSWTRLISTRALGSPPGHLEVPHTRGLQLLWRQGLVLLREFNA